MRQELDRRLKEVYDEVILMGAVAEDAFELSREVLLAEEYERPEIIKSVKKAEKSSDIKQRKIENLCMQILIAEQPVASDFRTVTAAKDIAGDLERICDQAADIAELSPYILNLEKDVRDLLSQMAEDGIKILKMSLDAFVRDELDTAHEAARLDDLVDDAFVEVKKRLLRHLASGELAVENKAKEKDKKSKADAKAAKEELLSEAESYFDVVMAAKYFERMADHAVNIAESVIFLLSGTHEKY